MMNNIFLCGVYVAQPELTYLQSGSALLKFRGAFSRKPAWGETVENGDDFVTDWYNVSYFGKPAEGLYDLISQGRVKSVNISGVFTPRNWTDKKGCPRVALEIQAHDIRVCAWKDAPTDAGDAPSHATKQVVPDDDF